MWHSNHLQNCHGGNGWFDPGRGNCDEWVREPRIGGEHCGWVQQDCHDPGWGGWGGCDPGWRGDDCHEGGGLISIHHEICIPICH